MFVVRIETDEALMFRAFRRLPAAKLWAVSRSNDEDFYTIVDVYEIAGLDDEMRAIKAVRDGNGRLVVSGSRLAFHDVRQSANFLAGVGIGTGAGF